MEELKPASRAKGPTYDPTSMTMSQDSVFAEVAPGSANSGNLAHKWGASTDHTDKKAPPTGLKGD